MKRAFCIVALLTAMTSSFAAAADVNNNSTIESIQQQLTVSRIKPQQFNLNITTPGRVQIDLIFKGEPIIVSIRNAAGQVLASATVKQPSGQAVFNISAALLKSGYAFNLLLASNGNASGQVRIISPKAVPTAAAQQKPTAGGTASTVQPAVQPLQNLTPVANWESRIRADKVRIAEGMEFRVKDYIRGTSFINNAALKPAFDTNFQRRLLKRPMQYTEDVQDLGDRLYVKRTMLLDAINPCDPEIERAGISICFKPTGKAIKPESKQYLDQLRAKIQQKVSASPNDPESIRVKSFLKMTDAQLMDQILNKEDTTKIISHESVVPYVVYEFNKVPAMEMFDFKRPIPRLNQLTSIQQGAFTAHSGFTGNAAGISAGASANISQQGAGNANINQAGLSQETSAPTTYTFPNTNEINAKVLTGWTIGKSFGDRFEVTFAKERWWHDRYYASFKYNITAGFGLRWPFEVKAKSSIDKVYGISNQRILDYPATQICQGNFVRTGEQAKANAFYCAQRANVNVQATPVNGDAAFYQATGLSSDKIFKGQEFVFNIGATCNFYGSIPGPNLSYSCPGSLKGFDFGRDFVPQLGSTPRDLFNYTIKGHDIGLELGFRFGYAAMNPGVTMTAHSGSLKLGVAGYQATPSTNAINIGSSPATFTVSENNASGNWGLELYNPQYNVSAKLVPSLQVEIGVDLGIYEWSKKFGPYDIDSLGIELGNTTFPTHQGTKSNFEMKNIGTRPPR